MLYKFLKTPIFGVLRVFYDAAGWRGWEKVVTDLYSELEKNKF